MRIFYTIKSAKWIENKTNLNKKRDDWRREKGNKEQKKQKLARFRWLIWGRNRASVVNRIIPSLSVLSIEWHSMEMEDGSGAEWKVFEKKCQQ